MLISMFLPSWKSSVWLLVSCAIVLDWVYISPSGLVDVKLSVTSPNERFPATMSTSVRTDAKSSVMLPLFWNLYIQF